ncbi:MAG TPA: acyl-CoA thioesterase II [Acidimicrobiales bacterium]
MGGPGDRLTRLLELQPLGDDRYEAGTPGDGPGRLFGGQVAGQALRAATLTVEPDRRVHSLHAYFIRPGKPGEPLRLDVERTRDGRSFTTRRVEASQSAGPIFTLAASFHVAEDGDDWQLPAPLDVPDPDDIEPGASLFSQMWTLSPFDVRPVHAWEPESPPTLHPLWVRTRDRLPDDPAVHAAVIAFFSDMGVVGSARAPTSTLPPRFMGASLDHAVWFHRAARADEWLLYAVDPVSNAGARGLARGTMHTRDGVLVASIAQEALLRDSGQVPLP